MDLLEKAKKKKARIQKALVTWYSEEARDLPWRRTRDPYRIWLSEIMLQQTRVETVIPYYRRFLKAFPSVKKLAAAKEDRLMKLWEGLGYYNRAQNLHRAANGIVRDCNGRFPRSAAEWEKLPGVGRYTAGAVASIAFGEPAPVLDGNVKRVVSRLFAITSSIDTPKTVRALWSIAEILVPPSAPGDFNQAMMELGARVCIPRRPFCGECPLKRICAARKSDCQNALPVRREKKPLPYYRVVAAAICRRGRYLIGKRPAGGLLGGLWEFPGGKVEPGEGLEDALARELHEEMKIKVRIGEQIASVKHTYSHFKITLYVYRCTLLSGEVRLRTHKDMKWVFPGNFQRYAFPTATRKMLHLV